MRSRRSGQGGEGPIGTGMGGGSDSTAEPPPHGQWVVGPVFCGASERRDFEPTP